MNLEFVVTLLNDIKPPALVLIDRDGAGGVIVSVSDQISK